jgi:hypothetical protein
MNPGSLNEYFGILPFPPRTMSMARDTFAGALRKGQGRALMHVRHHGLNDVADLVLAACLEDQSYDPQCEGGRAAWMIQRI